jgi:hypothetical protein
VTQNLDRIRHNKDKQEAAIYVFTIVTIIFPPISTVASVLGMNTRDIRNMDKPQWGFWAVSIPLTTLVVVISFFAAGSFQWQKDVGEKIVAKGPTKTVGAGATNRVRRRRSSSFTIEWGYDDYEPRT